MKRAILLLIVSLPGMTWADWLYDPNNPNPSQSDVWAAEHNAMEHRNRAVEATMSNRDPWRATEEQQKAYRAQRDADEMRQRMWQNDSEEIRRRVGHYRQTNVDSCENYNDFKKELKRGAAGEPNANEYADFNSFRDDFVEFYFERHHVAPDDNYTRTKLEKYARERWGGRRGSGF